MNDKKNIEFTTDDMYKDPNEQKDEVLEERLRRRIKIRDEDQEIYDTTDNSSKRNQAHEDVKNSNNEIARIEKVLEERKNANPLYYEYKDLSTESSSTVCVSTDEESSVLVSTSFANDSVNFSSLINL